MLHLKRLLSAVAVIGFLLGCSFSVQAEEPRTLEEVIVECCIYDTSADISEFEVTPEEVAQLYQQLQAEGKLPWYASTSYYCRPDTQTGNAVTFDAMSLDTALCDQTLYEQQVADILDKCVLEGMADWQIALSIHDHLAANAAYDESLHTRTGYNLLVDGTSVCSGYAEAYQDLLNRVGIPCISVTSEPMNHVWNLVNLDGSWYHVDLTWADPTSDTYGQVDHAYFLLTDEEISAGENPHYDWETDIACTDTRFSDAFWTDVDSQICYTDSDTCYFIREKDWNNYIYERRESTGEETKRYTDKCTYINIGHGEYTYAHTGLSLWNGRLYFCSMTEVLSILPDGTDLQTVLRYDTRAHKKYLGGCFVKNDTAYLTLRDHDGNQAPDEEPLASSGYHAHSFTQTVYDPTCLEPGYTVSVCACGLECTSKPTAATGHDYQRTEEKESSFFEEGYTVDTCTGCGDTVTETLPKADILFFLTETRLLHFGVGIVIVLFSLLIGKRRKVKV